MSADDLSYMRLAIAEARKCRPEDDRAHPFVGAVVVKNGKVIATGFRGELSAGDHAEYTALEKKVDMESIAGATVYTTLEPCTRRNEPKLACAERLIERKVARVVIGMLDPNPVITGKGQRRLREANIHTALFPPELMAEVEELNRSFARAQKSQAESSSVAKQESSGSKGSGVPSVQEPDEPRPNVIAVMTHERRVYWDHSRREIELGDGTRFDTQYTALVVPFRNDAAAGRRVGDAYNVKARIAIGNGSYPVTGYWMQSDRDHISMPVGGYARELIVAVREREGRVHAIDDRRNEDNFRPPEVLPFWMPQMPAEPFTVDIQLVANGIVINHSQYTLTLRPFELVPNSSKSTSG